MMKFFKQLFCGHYVSMEVCKIHYKPNLTELEYQRICKDCGKKIGKSTIKSIAKV
ncbi:hypothetical protein XbC2_496 [Xanthomonas phage XbC2]|nr:hypothetical protein XbC2_496 [Xanthomonas phage XbC2]